VFVESGGGFAWCEKYCRLTIIYKWKSMTFTDSITVSTQKTLHVYILKITCSIAIICKIHPFHIRASALTSIGGQCPLQ